MTFVINKDGTIIDVSQLTLDFFGYSRAEMIGGHVDRLFVHPGDKHKLQQETANKGCN